LIRRDHEDTIGFHEDSEPIPRRTRFRIRRPNRARRHNRSADRTDNAEQPWLRRRLLLARRAYLSDVAATSTGRIDLRITLTSPGWTFSHKHSVANDAKTLECARGVRMRRTLLFLSFVTTATATSALARNAPPTLATDIPPPRSGRVNSQPPAGDKLIRSIDIGAYASASVSCIGATTGRLIARLTTRS
jgi:hypothetical protein